MANNFCRYLSNGYSFRTNGQNLIYKPCCWFKQEIDLTDSNFEKQKDTISNITEWTDNCSVCKNIEQSKVYGEHSPRQQSFVKIPTDIPNNVPGWIELSIDTTCNAACIMCGPQYSTTWEKQEIKFGIRDKSQVGDRVQPEVWLSKIKEMFPLDYVKSVSFLGGEPFLSDIPLIILTELKSLHGNLNDVTVHFQTNGSVRPKKEIINLIKDCKRVWYNLSIDGTESRFEYVRYPLKWKKILSTVSYVQNLSLTNIEFIVLATLNPLNIYYYDELEHWVSNYFCDNDVKLKPNRTYGTLDLSNTPTELKKEIYKKYGVEHPISKMLLYLLPTNSIKFIQDIEMIDQYRHTDWQTTFPEIVKYFK